MQETQVQSLGQEDPLENKMATHPVFLPGESHGQRNLVGHSPWGGRESDTAERLHFDFSLSCIGEGMETHSSILALKVPRTEEPGGLQSMG